MTGYLTMTLVKLMRNKLFGIIRKKKLNPGLVKWALMMALCAVLRGRRAVVGHGGGYGHGGGGRGVC